MKYPQIAYCFTGDVADRFSVQQALQCNGRGIDMVMHLAGGKGGLEKMLTHFAPGIEDWWQTMMENPDMGQQLQKLLVDGIDAEAGNISIDELEEKRDARLIKLLGMLRETS